MILPYGSPLYSAKQDAHSTRSSKAIERHNYSRNFKKKTKFWTCKVRKQLKTQKTLDENRISSPPFQNCSPSRLRQAIPKQTGCKIFNEIKQKQYQTTNDSQHTLKIRFSPSKSIMKLNHQKKRIQSKKLETDLEDLQSFSLFHFSFALILLHLHLHGVSLDVWRRATVDGVSEEEREQRSYYIYIR